MGSSCLSSIVFDSFQQVSQRRDQGPGMERNIFLHLFGGKHRDYIFFNEKKFVQSRLVLVDLSDIDQTTSLYRILQDGVMDIKELMKIHPEMHVKLTDPILPMVKQPIIEQMDQWEERISEMNGESEKTAARWPSPLLIYGPPHPGNLNLTPLEAYIVKICYLPGCDPNQKSSSWYKEESLLRDLVCSAKIPVRREDNSIELVSQKSAIKLGWLFNSVHSFEKTLRTAVKRAHFFLQCQENQQHPLPPNGGLLAEHVNKIKLCVHPPSQSEVYKLINSTRNKKSRQAAVIGVNKYVLSDFLRRRLEYIISSKKALRAYVGRQLSEQFAVIMVYAAYNGKYIDTKKHQDNFWTFLHTDPTVSKISEYFLSSKTNGNSSTKTHLEPSSSLLRSMDQPSQRVGEGEYTRECITDSTNQGAWSSEEVDALIGGKRKYNGVKTWKSKILRDVRFGPILRGRSSGQCNDKFRDLVKSKKLKVNEKGELI